MNIQTSEVECFKVILKKNSLVTVREWAARMNTEMENVRVLLRNEGITLESVFLEQTETEAALIYYL